MEILVDNLLALLLWAIGGTAIIAEEHGTAQPANKERETESGSLSPLPGHAPTF
jgi:hypothetical protein